jgi:hypothetical protein
MTDIVTERRKSQDQPPVPKRIAGRKEFLRLFREVCFSRDYVENPASKIHYPETMLKSGVRGAWIDQICKSQLVNVAEPLIRHRIDYGTFMAVQPDERMDRISNFVDLQRSPRHDSLDCIDI